MTKYFTVLFFIFIIEKLQTKHALKYLLFEGDLIGERFSTDTTRINILVERQRSPCGTQRLCSLPQN